MKALAAAMRAAGLVGVEPAGALVFARLPRSDAELSAWAEEGIWHFAVSRPVRANNVQLRVWSLEHPEAPLDFHDGETRLLGRFLPEDVASLLRWTALAEDLVVASLQWRRDQRARGEGM